VLDTHRLSISTQETARPAEDLRNQSAEIQNGGLALINGQVFSALKGWIFRYFKVTGLPLFKVTGLPLFKVTGLPLFKVTGLPPGEKLRHVLADFAGELGGSLVEE